MASDRSMYDMGVYNIKTEESSKPLSYMFTINAHENCNICGDTPNVSVHMDRVNLENDLFGLTRKLSRDPKEKYQFNPSIANTLNNYVPPYLCERYITDPSFINPTNKNSYIEDLKKISIKDFQKTNNIEQFGQSEKNYEQFLYENYGDTNIEQFDSYNTWKIKDYDPKTINNLSGSATNLVNHANTAFTGLNQFSPGIVTMSGYKYNTIFLNKETFQGKKQAKPAKPAKPVKPAKPGQTELENYIKANPNFNLTKYNNDISNTLNEVKSTLDKINSNCNQIKNTCTNILQDIDSGNIDDNDMKPKYNGAVTLFVNTCTMFTNLLKKLYPTMSGIIDQCQQEIDSNLVIINPVQTNQQKNSQQNNPPPLGTLAEYIKNLNDNIGNYNKLNISKPTFIASNNKNQDNNILRKIQTINTDLGNLRTKINCMFNNIRKMKLGVTLPQNNIAFDDPNNILPINISTLDTTTLNTKMTGINCMEPFESGYVSPDMLFELLIDYSLNQDAESTTNLTNALNSQSINDTINNMMNNHSIKKILPKLKQGLPQERIDTLTGLSNEQKTQLLVGLTQDQINTLINFLTKFAETTNNINEEKKINYFIKYLSKLR